MPAPVQTGAGFFVDGDIVDIKKGLRFSSVAVLFGCVIGWLLPVYWLFVACLLPVRCLFAGY